MATPTNTPSNWRDLAACRDEPALFSTTALDYHPLDEEYAHLTVAEHRDAALRKAAAERAAVNKCFDCPVMQQCDAWALTTIVSGVVGGRTESEREPILIANGVIETTEATVTMAVDRGPRNQINDEAVDRMTRAGWSAMEIARELGCSTRSITRARDRINAAAAHTDTLTAVTQQAAAATAIVEAAPEFTETLDLDVIAELTTATLLNIPTSPAAASETLAAAVLRHDDTSPMSAVYATLADGQWHSRAELVAAALPLVNDTDALTWWTRRNTRTTTIDGETRTITPDRTPTATELAAAKRDKIANALRASSRDHVGSTTRRDGHFRITTTGFSKFIAPAARALATTAA